MTKTKENFNKRHVDLSWPKHASVDNAVKKNIYLDSYFVLKYPSVDDLAEELRNLGPGALLYKTDISRAFIHIHIDSD